MNNSQNDEELSKYFNFEQGYCSDNFEQSCNGLIDYFKLEANKFYSRHRISRRLSLAHFYNFLLCLVLAGVMSGGAYEKLFSFLFKIAKPNFDINPLLRLAFIAMLIFPLGYALYDIGRKKEFWKNFKPNFSYLITILEIPGIILLFSLPEKTEFKLSILFITGFSFTLSLYSYLENRLLGYTRARSRNITIARKIELIQINFKFKQQQEVAEAVKEKILADSFNELLAAIQIESEQKHKDLVDDYIFYGNSVSSFINKLPKKEKK